MTHPTQTVDRVLVIGLDGATFDVLRPLAEDGTMPNLAELLRRAAAARLMSSEPAITPAAWTTFLTGRDTLAHRVLDFRYLDHHNRQVRLNHPGRVAIPTIFDDLQAAGDDVISINLPMTSAARARGRSIIVGGLDLPSGRAALAPYPKLAESVRRSGTEYSLRVLWKRRPQSFEELAGGVAATEQAFNSRVRVAQAADRMVDWRLMVVQFQNLDSFQHRCWHLLGIDGQPGGPLPWIAEARHVLVALDRCVGELLELAARRSAAVAVVSDHGFGPFRQKIATSELLRRGGLLAPGRYGAMNYRLARARFKVRRWLRRTTTAPESTAAIARNVRALLPVDWRRSAAVCLHANMAALVYANTPQRFDQGPVRSPRCYQQVTHDIVGQLLAARHSETGESLFTSAWRTADRIDGDPLDAMLPDVVGIPAPGFHTRHKLDPGGRLLRHDPSLTGTHRADGVLMLEAPGIIAEEHPSAHLRDVAPTLLGLLGRPNNRTMDGQPLHHLFEESARIESKLPAAQQAGIHLRAAASHAGVSHTLDGTTVRNASDRFGSPGAEHEAAVNRRLRQLGYLD